MTSQAAQVSALATTLALAGLGAGAFHLVGFPAAPLTGSAVCVTLAGLAGLRVLIPDTLRDIAFLTLGISIGGSVTPDVIRAATTWPLSFLVLALTLLVSSYSCRLMLERGFRHDRATATLASTPGHLGYVLSLATDTRADLVTVSLVQSTRVLLLTLCVPPVIALFFGAAEPAARPETVTGIPQAAALYGAGTLLGLGFKVFRIPAAFLLAGMATSATGQLTELSPGRLPDSLAIAALMIMGALIGTRFRAVPAATFRSAFLAGLAVTLLALSCAILGALLTMALLGLPLGPLIVAFAPGGVEAMVAIAVQAGLDPTFVAAHHVARLALLTILVPVIAGGLTAPKRDR